MAYQRTPLPDGDEADAARIAAFKQRRERLGLSLEAMAAGIAWRAADVAEVEDGQGSDIRNQFYFDWLDRLESMKPDKLALNILRTRNGERFSP